MKTKYKNSSFWLMESKDSKSGAISPSLNSGKAYTGKYAKWQFCPEQQFRDGLIAPDFDRGNNKLFFYIPHF